jgi:hypothetical protein
MKEYKSPLSMTSAELEADQHKKGRKPKSPLKMTSKQLGKREMAKKMKKDVNYLFKSPKQEIKRIRDSIND